MMNLAFVIKTLDSRGGGAERVLTQVTSELVKRGHDVTLLTFGGKDEPDFYPVHPQIKRVWLGIGDVQAPSGVIDLLRRVKSLRRVIHDLAPDVAVGFMHSAYVPLALALATSSIQVVASEHISYDHFRRLRLDALILRATASLYSRMTVLSDAVRKDFPFYLSSRMEVVPNPVAPMGRSAEPVGGRRKILLNVGRLVEQKDQRTLIDAFAQVAAGHPEWILRIVGQGPLRSDLEAVIATHGLQKRVELAGIIEDMEGEYGSAQLFVMSSLYESFGLATAEALSAGIPAIGFADCAGTNELIRHRRNGLLVQGTDRVSALAVGLDELMSSPQLRQRMGAEGPASVRAFEIEAVGAKWEALLREVSRKWA
jgi:glycosyltransferase involved in cell wall biosynthesis